MATIEEFIRLVDSSLDPNRTEEEGQIVDQNLIMFYESPKSTELFISYLDPRYINIDMIHKDRALFYLYRNLKKNYVLFEEDFRTQIKQFFIEIIKIPDLKPLFLNRILYSINVIYSKDIYYWPELIELILNLVQNPQFLYRCSSVFNIILDDIKSEMFEDLLEELLKLSITCLNSNNDEIVINGCLLYQNIVTKCKTMGFIPESDQHAEKFLQIAQKSISFSAINYQKFWGVLKCLNYDDSFPEQFYQEILPIIFQISSDETIAPEQRQIAVDSVFSVLHYISQESVIGILKTEIDLLAKISENDQEFPNDASYPFAEAFEMLSHSIVYPMAKNIIQEAISSGNPYLQGIAIILLNELINSAPEFSQNDLSSISNLIFSALSSDNEIIFDAVLNLIYLIGEKPILKLYGATYINKLIPYIIKPEISEKVSKACIEILDVLDEKISGFFDQYFQLSKQITKETLIPYLLLFPNVIETSSDLEDKNIDEIFNLLENIFSNTNSDNIKAASLRIGIAVIKVDDSQISFLIEIIFPIALSLLKLNLNEYHNIVKNAIYFYSDFIKITKDNFIEYLPQFEEPINIIKNIAQLNTSNDKDANVKSVQANAFVLISKMAKHSTGNLELNESLIQFIIPIILNASKLENDIITDSVLKSICKLSDIVDVETKTNFFDLAKKTVSENNNDDDIICSGLKSLGKIIKSINIEDKSLLDEAIKFVETLLTCFQEQLNKSGSVFIEICYFLDEFFRFQTPISNSACKFLIDYCIQSENDFDFNNSLNPFISAVENNSISGELANEIIELTFKKISTINDPDGMQNTVFLFNVCIKKHPDFQKNIINLLPIIYNWLEFSISQENGYSFVISNIASLFMSILVNVIDSEPGKSNVIVSDPEKKKMFTTALECFPPADFTELNNMASAIVKIAQNGFDNDCLEATTNAILRYIVWDEASKAKIDNEIQNALFVILRAGDIGTINLFRSKYRKSRNKLRKIDMILSEINKK